MIVNNGVFCVFMCVLLHRNRRDVQLRMLVNTFLECYVSGGLRVLMKSSMMIQYLGLLWFWLDIHRYLTLYFSLLNPQIGLLISFLRKIFAHDRFFDFDFFFWVLFSVPDDFLKPTVTFKWKF